jgi:NurA-like 5'-3' nuclease
MTDEEYKKIATNYGKSLKDFDEFMEKNLPNKIINNWDEYISIREAFHEDKKIFENALKEISNKLKI